MNTNEMKTKVLLSKEGYCPKCKEPIYNLKMIKRGKRYYLYAEHYDGVHRTLHYLGPAQWYKHFFDNLFVVRWLVKKGYLSLDDYIKAYKKVLVSLTKDDMVKFSDIKEEIIEIIKKKIDKEELEGFKKMLS